MSASWEICSQVADSMSLLQVEWNRARIVCSHWDTLCVCSQNEGNKVDGVKVQETAFICNCFFENHFPSNSIPSMH